MRASEGGAPAAKGDQCGEDDTLPPLLRADRLGLDFSTPLPDGCSEIGDERMRSVSPSQSVDAPMRGSSASSPPMSPTSHDDSVGMCTDSLGRMKASSSSVPTAQTLNGMMASHEGARPTANALDPSAAAALPNVAEYLHHMERHQRAYSMQHKPAVPNAMPQQGEIHPLLASHQGVADWRGLPPPPMAPGAAMPLDASHGCWPDMMGNGMQMTALPPPAAPRVPTAATPAPTDDDVPDTSLAANPAPGSLPFAHATPLPLPTSGASAIAAPLPASMVAAAQPASSMQSAGVQGVLQGGVPAPGALPTDAASLSMLYAALSSHFAQVAHTPAQAAQAAQVAQAAVAQGMMPGAPPPNPAAMLSAQGFSSPQGVGLPPHMPMADANVPSNWWPPARQQAAMPSASYVPGAPANMVGVNPVGVNPLSPMVPESLKRRAESALRGGCAMSSGAPNMNPLMSPQAFPAAFGSAGPVPFATGLDASGVVKGGLPVPSDLRASKQPRRAMTSAACAPAACESIAQQFSLAQNLASACGASEGNTTKGSSISRQMSDEEVFSMFADELQSLEGTGQEIPPYGFDGNLVAMQARLSQEATVENPV